MISASGNSAFPPVPFLDLEFLSLQLAFSFGQGFFFAGKIMIASLELFRFTINIFFLLH